LQRLKTDDDVVAAGLLSIQSGAKRFIRIVATISAFFFAFFFCLAAFDSFN